MVSFLDTQLYNFMNHSALYPLLPTLFDLFNHIPSSGIWNSVIKYCWKECLYRLKMDDRMMEGQIEYSSVLPNIIQIKEYLKKDTTKYKCAFGILDGYVWKFKFEGKLKKVNFSKSEENSKLSIKNWSVYGENEIIESWNAYLGFDEVNYEIDKIFDENEMFESQNICFDSDTVIDDKRGDFDKYLNLHLFNPDMNTIHELFQNAMANAITSNFDGKAELYNDLIKWEAEIDNETMNLQVFKKFKNSGEWRLDPICKTSIRIGKIEDAIHVII